MGWASILKAALRLGGRATKATATTMGSAVLHPQQTLKGMGTAVKSATVGGTLGYIGWEKLTTDKSVVGIVSDAVIGEKTTDKIGDTISDIGDGVRDIKDSVNGLSNGINGAVSSVDSKWEGMSGFLRAMFSGHGGDMIGNFFSNIGRGNVSGLSIVGLVVSALLVFGRFGWLGKIAGAVLGRMMIGNNANMSQVLGGQRQAQPQVAQATPEQGQSNGGG